MESGVIPLAVVDDVAQMQVADTANGTALCDDCLICDIGLKRRPNSHINTTIRDAVGERHVPARQQQWESE
jgi:hypothetical protein